MSRLNYRKIINGWMEFYHFAANLPGKMFTSIWARMQDAKEKEGERKEKNNGKQYLERSDRESENQ